MKDVTESIPSTLAQMKSLTGLGDYPVQTVFELFAENADDDTVDVRFDDGETLSYGQADLRARTAQARAHVQALSAEVRAFSFQKGQQGSP